jgi:hypothetical protein
LIINNVLRGVHLEGLHITNIALFEHQFWLQIMGDHSRFIFYSLAPTESIYLQKSQDFIILFDQLLDEAKRVSSDAEITDLGKKAYELTHQLRGFKLELLAATLNSDIKAHLSSTFFNDMLNELEEYLLTIRSLMNNENQLYHPIHYHMLWLPDAVGHAASIGAELDLVERDMIDKAKFFEMQFSDLTFKATMMNGYLRTQLGSFPSLDRLNDQANIMITAFMEYLEYIRDQRIDKRILGTLMPLMADHMAREECYYMWKLSQISRSVKRPECLPTRPRVEV